MKARLACAAALTALALPLAGCDRLGGGDGDSADTQMKNVEILPGTASDEMVTLDQASGDGTAIDQSRAIGPATPGPAPAAGADDDEEASADAGAQDVASESDVVIRPPAGGAEPVNAAPAEKK